MPAGANPKAVRQRGQDAGLVHGIQTIHIHRRIGFGVAQFLRLRQGGSEFGMLQFHPGEDVIAGAVDDAVNMGNPVAHKPFAQSLDNGNAPGHAGFVIEVGAVLARGGEQFLPVGGDQGLVGRDDRLAQAERRQDHGLGDRGSADQLHDGVNLRVVDHGQPVGGH